MSLNDELKSLHKTVLASLPAEVRESLLAENRKLFANFVDSKVIKVGERVPDVLFRDKDLAPVYLKDILLDQHVVLNFFRGTWCPYCNLELEALQSINRQVEAKGARIIAASPELYSFSSEVLERKKIHLPVYTDLGNLAAEKFGLVFELPAAYRQLYRELNIYLDTHNDNEEWTLPVPATFVISRRGIITASFVNPDYTQRMEPTDILRELDQLNS